jgi:DNA-binding MarR family transcriptional regulator
MTQKHCPFCNFRHPVTFNPRIDISPGSNICPECGEKYEIITTLTDTRRAGKTGGFRLIKPFAPKVDTTEILKCISTAKYTHAVKIAQKLRKSPVTIRTYLIKMENDGLITREIRGNYKIVHLTEYGRQVLA